MENRTTPKEHSAHEENRSPVPQNDPGRFDFTGMIEDEHEHYIFANEAIRQEFISELKKRLDYDAYMWDHITQSIMIASADVASQMNLQEQE